VFCLWPQSKATEFWMDWWDIPSAEETEIPKVPHQDNVDNFFDCQGVVHKEFVPEEKTVNAEFYKGVMYLLLKRIQRVRPAAFYSRDVFLLHENAPAHKADSVCQFLTQNMLQPFITYHVLSRLICARLYYVPQVENEIKRTPLCGCSWDSRSRNWWIKEVPKIGIFCSFQKLYDRKKSLYIWLRNLFWIKNVSS